MSSPTLLLSAGDVSGDDHAAELVRAFRQRRPGARFVGLGGPAMRRAGVELAVAQDELAVGGLFELGRSAPRIAGAWRRMGTALDRARPDLVVLVDSGGFNLPFAARVRRRSSAPILFYVAPQVWAWRPGRIRKLARRVDRLAVIFPFEPEVYAGTGLTVEFVGHPLVDRMRALREQWDARSARALLGLDPEARWIALLPGSRRNEIDHQLPLQLETARRVHARTPGAAFVLALAPSIERARVDAIVRRAALPELLRLVVVEGRTPLAIRAADTVLAKPGSVTVEVTLLERPMVVMGRVNALTAAVLRRAVRVPAFAMPNLIAGKSVVPEFLQDDARPDAMADALLALLDGPVRREQLARLREVADKLGEGGAAERAAGLAEKMLGPPRA
ncbi:MAG: lipid-A-disaccharide synthase [Proteobacteria bacterium]|nr:lipid-A-disaccharide synthase [Pseudomonadota bacterium]